MRSNEKLAGEIWCFVEDKTRQDVCKCKVVTARIYTFKMWLLFVDIRFIIDWIILYSF